MNCKQLGITGGIGAGKSTVAHLFALLGIPVYNADLAARRLMETNADLRSAITKAFGSESYFPNHTLNRPYLAEKVFHHAPSLAKLNAMVHPKVGEDYTQWHARHAQQGAPYTLKEAALLFETGSYRTLEGVILVSASEEVRLQRVLHRDSHRTKAQVQAIFAKQLPEAEKQRLARWLIRNEGNEALIPQVLELHQKFIAR